jgi:hypothetical protein
MDRPTTPIQMLQAIPNLPGFDHGFIRFLVKETSMIKYITFPSDQDTLVTGFHPSRVSSVPHGDWNIGTFTNQQDTGEIIITSTQQRRLDGVLDLWHPLTVDYLDLESSGKLDANGSPVFEDFTFDVSGASCGLGPGQVTIVMEWWPEWVHRLKIETEVHACIQEQDIGPKFLAHLTENKTRVIGFIREKIEGRPATFLDFSSCQLALSKLHRCGYLLGGGLCRSNFLIQASGAAIIQSFGGCEKTNDLRAFTEEMTNLEGILSSGLREFDSTTPIKLGWDMMMEIHELSKRDDGIHPIVWHQALENGKVSISEKEHKWLLYEYRKRNGCANNFPPVVTLGPGKL